MSRRRAIAAGVLCCFTAAPSQADDALIAVASNFREAARQLEADFEQRTAHTLSVTIGSTGKLYSQIINGAPFDLLLAADEIRPARLLEAGKAGATPFPYALGRLVLWSADPERLKANGAAALHAGSFRRLAIANPELAPYGAAAMEVLERLELLTSLQSKLVMGENVGQTFALVATSNAELGFVALTNLHSPNRAPTGSSWEPPQSMYRPIRQDAVLLKRAADNVAATGFADYLRSADARRIIEQLGYGLP